MIYLRPDFSLSQQHEPDPFEAVLTLPGEIIKQLDGRRTLRFALDGRRYFLKAHLGVGWREILKNLSQLRLPVVSARNEWQAIQRLKQLGVHTTPLVGYGVRGINPARRQSFVITEALEDTVTLEDFCRSWETNPPRDPAGIRFKRALIAAVARVARTLHENGINHRDFYLCHFRLASGAIPTPDPRVYLMDLHRVQMRGYTPRRWIVKDLGSLYFSAMDIRLTRRDLLRFIGHYRSRPLRTVLIEERRLWETVRRRAHGLYRPFHGREPPPGY